MTKKILLWILCIFWAIIIFSFSSEPAVESDKTSLGFTEKIIVFLADINIIDIPVSSIEAEAIIHDVAEQLNNIIRKVAHFTVFLIFGVLVYELSLCYFINKKALVVALIVCLLYAISDEIHQVFVPGRAGQVRDVLIDFMGSFTGTMLCFITINIYKRIKKRMQ